MALNVLLFGRKITPIPVSLINFRLGNFQLILGFEKRTGKRAILKKKKERKKERDGRKNPQRYDIFQRINLKRGREILRSNGTKILRETYENCRAMMLHPPRFNRNDAMRLPSRSRLSLAFHSLSTVSYKIYCTIPLHILIIIHEIHVTEQ